MRASGIVCAVAAVVATGAMLQPDGVFAAGDPERGKTLYAVCATCHGDAGEGMADMNGPALAGREGWYLKRQIRNFKSGARGGDERDTYGRQMAPMAQLLTDDQAIDDVVAWLESLGD